MSMSTDPKTTYAQRGDMLRAMAKMSPSKHNRLILLRQGSSSAGQPRSSLTSNGDLDDEALDESVSRLLPVDSEETGADSAEANIVPFPAVHVRKTTDLDDALRDLDTVVAEADEEGFGRPSVVAKANAERLLRQMYRILPRRFEVYPTPDEEIAIDVPSGRGSVILLCDSAGGALCLVNVNGDQRRARYSSSRTLPDGFIREALADLA